MAFLHRYRVKIQQRRVMSMDAINEQHSKQLAEQDVNNLGDVIVVISEDSTLVQENVGAETNGTQLNRYDVTLRFIRNIVLDAEDKVNSLFWANQDTIAFPGTYDIRTQGVSILMKEKTGQSS